MAKSSPVFAGYFARQTPAQQNCLIKLEALIKSIVPEAEELISYQVPSFKLHYMLVGIGVNKDGCSLYIMSTALARELKEELKNYTVSGTTLHFDPEKPLPEKIIRKIVLARVRENETRLLAGRKKK